MPRHLPDDLFEDAVLDFQFPDLLFQGVIGRGVAVTGLGVREFPGQLPEEIVLQDVRY